ncbi:hypothetical protein [Sinorhizobium fredii]|uniref:Uncharacterized protein n=2 Tax=Rhizobium fredii TaxID=380 RepID=A0A2A6LY50_RHIFR|nr:hypothetical protein [Sinorhizobium fredii]ASY68099.1 hypothetical protein SF83666_c06590 [Sinorhizobium fredii CCBAU 83666]PDT47220.1 hypothetical protein CO661_13620 [Sinorhizobium fredii]CCE95185.1 hypothetical protein SFHH103_00686 [Sinorhizobium fredii HH103]
MRRVFLAFAFLIGPALPATAQDDWHPYSNPRFGYTVEIPPGFEMHQQADNNDGVSFHADDNGATLTVFGTHPPAGDFETDVADRIGYEKDDDWRILYSRVTPAWASFSGARGGEVFYTRAIALCDGSAAYFRLQYRKSKLTSFDGVISRMAAALRPSDECQPPE